MSSIFNFRFRSFSFSILYLLSFILCPFAFAEIEITPGISLSETYDDNLNLTDQNEISDYITAVSPTINVAHLSENTQFNLYYSPSFVWYADQSQNNTVRHSARLSLAQQLSQNLSLQLSDTYSRTEDPVEEFEDIEFIRTGRRVYQRNTGSAELQYRFGAQNTFNLGYANNLLINDDPALDNGVIHRPYMGYTYWFDIKNGITFDYGYTKAQFSRDDGLAPADDYQGLSGGITYNHLFKPQTTGSMGYTYTGRYFDGLTEDYQVHNASLGLTHSFSPDLNVSLQGGYFVQVRERTSDDFRGLSYNALLNRSFAWGNFQISGQGGWRESYLESYLVREQRGFTRFWSFQSGFTYQIAETVQSNGRVSYGRDENAADRAWTTVSGTIGLAWNFHRYFALALAYSYLNRDDDVSTSDYSRNQILLTLSASRLFRL